MTPAQRHRSTHVLAARAGPDPPELVTEAVRARPGGLARARRARPGRPGRRLAAAATGPGPAQATARPHPGPGPGSTSRAADTARLLAPSPPTTRTAGGPGWRPCRQSPGPELPLDPAGRLAGATMTTTPPACRRPRPHRLALRPGARYSRRGQGHPLDGIPRPRDRDLRRDRPNVITDVATMPATSDDRQALAGIHARLEHRGLLPRRAPGRRRLHLPRPHRTGQPRAPRFTLTGRCPQPHPPAPRPGGLRPRRLPHRLRPPEVACPRPGRRGMARPLPHLLARRRPLIVARFTKEQCQPCPARAACTTSGDGKRARAIPAARTLDCSPYHADQQDPAWRSATRCDPASGHRLRTRPRPRHARCRYRGQPQADRQHVLTAIAAPNAANGRPAKTRPTTTRTAFPGLPRPARHQTPALMASRQLSRRDQDPQEQSQVKRSRG